MGKSTCTGTCFLLILGFLCTSRLLHTTEPNGGGGGGAGVEFCRELQESIWILLGGVCESLWTLHSVCVNLLTVYESLTGFAQINLVRVFARVDSRTLVEIF